MSRDARDDGIRHGDARVFDEALRRRIRGCRERELLSGGEVLEHIRRPARGLPAAAAAARRRASTPQRPRGSPPRGGRRRTLRRSARGSHARRRPRPWCRRRPAGSPKSQSVRPRALCERAAAADRRRRWAWTCGRRARRGVATLRRAQGPVRRRARDGCPRAVREPLLQHPQIAIGTQRTPALVDDTERHLQVPGHAVELEVGGESPAGSRRAGSAPRAHPAARWVAARRGTRDPARRAPRRTARPSPRRARRDGESPSAARAAAP